MPSTSNPKKIPAYALLLAGIVLAALAANALQTPAQWYHWLAGITAFLLFGTLTVNFFSPPSKSWIFFSMWETERFNPYFDRYKKSGWLERVTEIGAVIGFGAVAIDFFWGRHRQKPWERVLIFAVSTIVLATAFQLVLGGQITDNPLAKGPALVYQLAFGLFGFAGFTIVGLLFQGIDGLAKISQGKDACAGVAPVIPGVQTPNTPFTVPIEAWVSLVAILIIHEASHGFLARRHNLKIESSGLLLAGILPIGAFVKPDEEKMKRMEPEKQVHMVAAGPTSNLASFLIVGAFFLLLSSLVIQPILSPSLEQLAREKTLGVKIAGVDQNTTLCGETFPSPAYGIVDVNSILLSVNDQNIQSASDAVLALRNNPTEPKILVFDSNGIIKEATLTPNALGRIGIYLSEIPNPKYDPPQRLIWGLTIASFVISIIYWFIILSFIVGIANFIPLEPFDGGRIAKLLITPYFGFMQMNREDTEQLVGRIFFWILIPLIIINALPIFL